MFFHHMQAKIQEICFRDTGIIILFALLGMYQVTLVDDSLYDWNIEILK